MSKKGVKTGRRGRKKAPKAGLRPGRQFLKILLSIGVLVLLVLGAVIVDQMWVDRPARRTESAQRSRTPVPAPAAVARPEQRPPKPPVDAPSLPEPSGIPSPSVPPAMLPESRLPLVAIIIDDIGYDRPIAEKFMSLEVPLTLSFLPHAPFSRTILGKARDKGLEAMLHLPMEPIEYPDVNPGPGALMSNMTPDELIEQLEQNISRLEGIKGVNNHMGSRLSASSEQMRQIFSILKKKGLYYVDSRTGAETAAPLSAGLLQLPFAERDIFIDHLEDAAFIRSQMDKLVQRARRQGYAIGIAHPHPITYDILKELMPELKEQVQIVPASMVVEQAMFRQAARKIEARK
jgi:uncharacterized protein